MHTVLVLNPGHFHAALVFRESHPRLSGEKEVFGEVRIDPDGSPPVYKESVHHLYLLAEARKRALGSPFEPLKAGHIF